MQILSPTGRKDLVLILVIETLRSDDGKPSRRRSLQNFVKRMRNREGVHAKAVVLQSTTSIRLLSRRQVNVSCRRSTFVLKGEFIG